MSAFLRKRHRSVDRTPIERSPAKKRRSIDIVKILLDITKGSTDVFPPLKSCLDGISALVKHYEQYKCVRDEVNEIIPWLEKLMSSLTNVNPNDNPEETERQSELARSLEHIRRRSLALVEKAKVKRFLDKPQDSQEVVGLMEKIKQAIIIHQMSQQQSIYDQVVKLTASFDAFSKLYHPLLVEAKIEPVPARLGQLGMGGGAVSEVDEFDRRKGLFETLEGMKLKLQALSERAGTTERAEKAGDMTAVWGLANDLRDAIVEYQFAQQEEIYEENCTLIDAAELSVLNACRHAEGAEFRHGDRQGCLKGTRKAVLDGMEEWSKDPNASPIYWLSGLAGTGKSTIAQTFAERLFADGSLGASFFCSRDFEDRRNLHYIFPTLAFQLAHKYPGFRSTLIPLLQSNPGIRHASLFNQMRALIVEPLSLSDVSTVIAIDALDECVDEEPQSALLSVMGRLVERIPNVKFLITGRPEPHIQSGFRLGLLRSFTDIFVLHKVADSGTRHDVANAHTIVSDVRNGVATTPTISSGIRDDIANTRAVVSDIHCITAEAQEGTDNEKISVVLSSISHHATLVSHPPPDPHLSVGDVRKLAGPAYGLHLIGSTDSSVRERKVGEPICFPEPLASSQLSLATTAGVDNNTGVRTEYHSTYPTGPAEQFPNPPVTVTGLLGVLPPPNAPSIRTRQSSIVHQTPDSSILIDPEVSACKRLLSSAFSPHELISLIEEIFTRKDEVKMIGSLNRDEAQAFIDVVHETLDVPDFPSQLRRKCLGGLCWTCGRHALLPKSLQISLSYNRSDHPLYRGGYADVWKGKYQGRHVAVKVLGVSSGSDFDHIMSRFCKEVVTWKALHHPNVLPLLGVTMDTRHFVMASEWMANGNINEFIKAHRDANRPELLKDVTLGLIYMHSQAMVHGDLKGANILIDQNHHALLADFGLLTIASDTTNFTSSSSRARGGTTRWMSPERLDPDHFGLKNSRPTKESDRYALGMVVLEVLSGRAPFASYSTHVVARKVTKGERPGRPEGPEGAWFTDDLWRILELCWAIPPESRPSIEAVLECLERASGTWEAPSQQAGEGAGMDEDDSDHTMDSLYQALDPL